MYLNELEKSRIIKCSNDEKTFPLLGEGNNLAIADRATLVRNDEICHPELVSGSPTSRKRSFASLKMTSVSHSEQQSHKLDCYARPADGGNGARNDGKPQTVTDLPSYRPNVLTTFKDFAIADRATLVRNDETSLVPQYLSALVPSKRAAFTLAEVLITLGIIGVVAAMTMPTLIQQKQDKELIVKMKKVWSDINNAILLSHQDYGVVGDNSLLFNATDSNWVVAENFAKYFKGAKVCKYGQVGCSQFFYDMKFATKQLDDDGTAKVLTVGNSSGSPRIILPNGAILMVSSNPSGCEERELTQTKIDSDGKVLKDENGDPITYTYTIGFCGMIAFDVNGKQGPNQYGRDVYYSFVHKDKLGATSDSKYGAKSFKNILSGKDKLEYFNYSKGQKFD